MATPMMDNGINGLLGAHMRCIELETEIVPRLVNGIGQHLGREPRKWTDRSNRSDKV